MKLELIKIKARIENEMRRNADYINRMSSGMVAMDQQDVENLEKVKEEQVKLIKECGVFVSPALYGESFGIVLLEAMKYNKSRPN
jgi:glycosyltransferase involved in cell wall biosynthesis